MKSSELEHYFLSCRRHFPILERTIRALPFVYLDSAATAQKPLAVIEAIRHFYAHSYGTVHRAVYQTAAESSHAYQEVREKIARFLNAKESDEIIFQRGTTSAINLVASSFGKAFVQSGDEVIITEMEHHSNIVPWQMMCEARKATLRVIPFLDNGTLDMQALRRELNSKTKIVAVAHISNVLGTINPITEIIALAHNVGAKVLVDGAQSAPHMPINVQALDADFFVFSGHKAVGPTGIGILYGKKELLEAMPPFEGGGDMIETVTFPHTTYNVPPLKFEAGTPSIAEVIGLGAAIDFLSEIGLQKIALWEQELLNHMMPQLQAIPQLTILGNSAQRGALATFSIEGVHPLDIATMLDLQGISVRSGHLCAQPVMRHFGLTAAVRASLAFYNTKEEIDRFITALHSVIKKLR